jgi:hypothetical protein
MQISGVSLTLTWPCRLCLLRVLLCESLCYKLSPFKAHWGGRHYTHFLWPVCLFTVHMGSGSSPLSCAVFLPPPLLQAFPLLIAGQCCCSCQLACLFTAHVGSGSSLLSCGVFLPPPLSQAFLLLVAGHASQLPPSTLHPGPACLFTVPGRIPLPLFDAQGTPPSLLCIFFCYYLLLSFSFFTGWGLVFPGGYADLAQGCLWEYCVPLNSPCGLHLPKPSGSGQLALAWGPSWFHSSM